MSRKRTRQPGGFRLTMCWAFATLALVLFDVFMQGDHSAMLIAGTIACAVAAIAFYLSARSASYEA